MGKTDFALRQRDDLIKEVVAIMQTGREFKQVFSPFHRGPLVSSILHDADHFAGTPGNYYVMVGETGIGYTNDPLIWKEFAKKDFAILVSRTASLLTPDNPPLRLKEPLIPKERNHVRCTAPSDH